ncbi:MAG: hypothetical protein ACR2PA_14345 [Hyphomicrobiaceae bacterium]
MGAVAHYIEEQGIATTGISLVRENTASIRPPRALWVPFDLGRPLGAPAEPEFQSTVLRAVLGLLERRDGPVILEDFPEDAPGQGSPEAMEGMVCPIALPRPPLELPASLIDAVLSEIDELAPWYELFRQTHDGETIGASGMAAKDAAQLLDEILRTGRLATADPDQSGKTVRYASESLRNYYVSAALVRPGGAAAAREIADWFWGDTSAGSLILALHPVCLASDDAGLKFVAEKKLVPRAQQHRLQAD